MTDQPSPCPCRECGGPTEIPPCRFCGKPASLTGPEGKPEHWTCRQNAARTP